jgi:uncharacterized OB-fold protein
MEIPRHWRLKAQRYRLAGSTCPACGRPIFPPRPVCPRCRAQGLFEADGRLALSVTSIGWIDLGSDMRPRTKESLVR